MADAPKLHIDSDWKAEAQREKERLSQKEAEKEKSKSAKSPPGTPGTPGVPGTPGKGASNPYSAPGIGPDGHPLEEGELPEASFKSLVGMLASQAIMGLGAMADPQTGRVVVDLEGSRFAIDLLTVLEEKTKGNLDAEETKELNAILTELRSRYVQISNLVSKQMAQQAAAAMAGGPGALGGPGGPGLGAGMPPLKM